MNIRINGKVIGKITVDNGWWGYELEDGTQAPYLYQTMGEARDAGADRYRVAQSNAAFTAAAEAKFGAIADPFAGLVRK